MKNDNLQERPLCLSGTGVTKVFGYGARANTAVDHVDFAFHEGELVSIVGESGSGKTTLSKMLLGLMNPTEGEIFFQGKPRDISTHARKKKYWRDIQAIFQDPFSSFNVFHKIDSVLLDCINMRGGRRLPAEKKVEMMTEACSFVNLKYAELTNKYPFELSGGQMQRLMIAVIFITHDIGLAYYISDAVYIMERGRFVESGRADDVILNPQAAYTKRLISDVPKIHEPWDLSTVGCV